MKRVGIAELKRRLSGYLRAAHAGTPVEVLDRGRAVARIVGVGARDNGLVVRPATGRMRDLPPRPRLRLDVDVVGALQKTRQNWR